MARAHLYYSLSNVLGDTRGTWPRVDQLGFDIALARALGAGFESRLPASRIPRAQARENFFSGVSLCGMHHDLFSASLTVGRRARKWRL